MSPQLNFFSIKIIFLKKIYPTWKFGCLHFQRYLWRLTLWSKVQIGHTGISLYIQDNNLGWAREHCHILALWTLFLLCPIIIQSVRLIQSILLYHVNHVIGEWLQKSREVCTYVFTSNFIGIMRFCNFLFEISFPILFSVSFSYHG